MSEETKIALSLGWLIVWLTAGFLVLYSHNTLLPFIYAAMIFGGLVLHIYLACTRCFYFGKKCYLLFGLVSAALFKQRKIGPIDPDDAFLAALWIFLALFPVPFLIYYQSWLLLAVFSALTFGWFIYRKQKICGACEND